MSKKDWGNPGWEFMHQIAIGYPNYPTPEDKYWAAMFLQSVGNVLPCKQCRQHFLTMLEENPPILDDSCGFQSWLYHVHNQVNKRLGKPIFTPEQYHQKYEYAIALHRERKKRGE